MAPDECRWNDWNVEHATRHGCTLAEIESVVRRAGRGYPRKLDAERWIVEGRGVGGRMVRVVYLLSPDPVVYVIHAMPLTTRRRRRRR